ncbi:MAG: HAMP domain-containing sensor histidine kinase [Lachnospiraceae bacterium]|nr:HAMP domain-containing sensor histidine kinase [Lachnospiraceae bacterium]
MKKKRKKRFVLPIAGGFLASYFVIMILATFLVKEKFMEDFARNYETRLGRMIQDIGEFEQGLQRLDAYSGDLRTTHYQALLAQDLNLVSTKYQQFSGAVYDSGGELVAKSENKISLTGGFARNVGQYELEYPLEEFLTPEEILTLAKYAAEAENGAGSQKPGPYRISVMVTETEKLQDTVQGESADQRELQDAVQGESADQQELQNTSQRESADQRELQDTVQDISQGWDLQRIVVQRISWEAGNGAGEEDPLTGAYHSWQAEDGKAYQQMDSEIVWEWENPNIKGSSRAESIPLSVWQSFPYLSQGYDCWQEWTENAYLHDFPQKMEEGKWKDGTVLSMIGDGFSPRFGSIYKLNFELSSDVESSARPRLTVGGEGDRSLSVVLLCDSHPWQAAADYMRYAYLGSFLFLLICIAVIVRMTEKTYERRALLEESRRDFTNAMAHELKTPLGIIRGMAENLQENTAPEKKDYYIRHIIGQTEEMDRLVAEMIYVSKLDSEQFTLKKEPIRWRELTEQQIEKLAPVIEEKKLCIRYVEKGETKDQGYDLEGDRSCLEKAVWNLLSNAVHWCTPGGTVTVTLEKGRCSIENEGPQISEEDLPHIFEMFYHGKDGNLGMGLYLTKRIAEMHGIKAEVENTDAGVKSVIG